MTTLAKTTQPGPRWLRLIPYLDWPWELVPLLIGAGWLYWQTMPPGMSSWIVEGWDSAMFQVTGSTWGVPHSPGYPLYTVLANLFVRIIGWLPGLGDSSLAWRVSLWSTCTSLLTLILVFLIVRRLSRNRIAGLISSGMLATSFIFWRGSIMAEVYSLNALIFALTFWLALGWDADRRTGRLVALGLVLGAGLVHHRTAFILPLTIALWVMLRRERWTTDAVGPQPRWRRVLSRWLILGTVTPLPLLFYLYLPWAAQNRVGQTWLYADASDWNTFWFIVVSREWWGLVQFPDSLSAWAKALTTLFWQQADQLTAPGVIGGGLGLLLARRYLLLLGPPFLVLTLFGVAYQVKDLDSMLIPLTLTLVIGFGSLIGTVIRVVATWLLRTLRMRDKELRGDKWLSTTLRTALSLVVAAGIYILFSPVAEANFSSVDLSGDWQAEDLVEEVVAMAQAGTPLTIIGQDNSVLPNLIYAQSVLGQPIEPLSTTTLSRLPEAETWALLQERLAQGRRLLVDLETLELGFIPSITSALERSALFQAPTGHPFLWELIPRPMSAMLPPGEMLVELPSGQLLEGRVSIRAYSEQVVPKRSGCFLRVTLFWQVNDALAEDYFVSVQPLGGDTVLDKKDHLALMRGHLPFSAVKPGELVRDEVDLLIRQPAALPSIQLLVNLYQVQGDQFPSFGEVILPIVIEPDACDKAG